MSSEVTPTEQAQVQTPYSAIMNGDAAVPATSTFSASINPVAALSTSNELTGRVGPSAEEIAGLGK